ncbi:MAG TPA: hypothetical protein VJS38_15565 [Phenylobacterium sp.]|uniref:hypothetical protein n=1 Tax=Phenylobacterium sp. TaxID=1871053 RepID=UPI002B4A51BE|nr:hypothetical protein [Phenylobacterium sp.]HKR89591.1 hypothetical protein [Phenylobacterium sp.]
MNLSLWDKHHLDQLSGERFGSPESLPSLVSAAVILFQRDNPEISATGGQKRPGVSGGDVAVFELNQTIFQTSAADVGAIPVAFISQAAHAAGGGAAGRPRAGAGDDIGSEI